MEQSAGWDAIQGALEGLYPGQEPLHYGTVIKHRLGGPDPLDGVSIYRAEQPEPHWHYVSFGFSELYEKESENTEWSGFGFEMTFRLKRTSDEPPIWPVGLMQNLARYVFNSGNVFHNGDYIDLNGPMALEEETRLTAAAFTPDPDLPDPLETPHGKLQFRQLVGLTAGELSACKTWKTSGVLELLPARAITDLQRSCLTEDSRSRQLIREGREQDGSRTGFLYVEQGELKVENGQCELTVGALAVDELQALLPGRIGFERPLAMQSARGAWKFVPAPEVSFSDQEIRLTPQAARALGAALRVKAGTYCVREAPELTIRVVPTPIRDHQGEIVRVLGE